MEFRELKRPPKFGCVTAILGALFLLSLYYFFASLQVRYTEDVQLPVDMTLTPENQVEMYSSVPVVIDTHAGRYFLDKRQLTRDGKQVNFTELTGPVNIYSPYSTPGMLRIAYNPNGALTAHIISTIAFPILGVLLIGTVFFMRTFVHLRVGEKGLVVGSDKTLERSGWNHIGMSAQAFALDMKPKSVTTEVKVMIQDGAQFEIEVSYVILPRSGRLKQLFERRDGLISEIKRVVQGSIQHHMQRYNTWYEAATRVTSELKDALEKEFVFKGVRESLETGGWRSGLMMLDKYGVGIEDFSVDRVEPVGDLAKRDIFNLARERVSFERDIMVMEYTISSIAELEKRKQELNEKYKGLEAEIEKFYKRVLFKIKEPR